MVLIVSRFEDSGGAAIASKRLFIACKKLGIKSKYLYFENNSFYKKICAKVFYELEYRLLNQLDSNNLRTLGLFSLLPIKKINQAGHITHLHWIHFNLLSLKSIKKINTPKIVTLHDSWWINDNASHYNQKVYKGIKGEILKFIDKEITNRKRGIAFEAYITPSKWLYERVCSEKPYLKDKTFLIPNALNTNKFYPDLSKSYSIIENIIVYNGGKNNKFKGGDLLLEFLYEIESVLIGSDRNLTFHIVGEKIPTEFQNFKLLNHGIVSEKRISEIYRMCECCLNFSRFENLCQFLTQACSSGLSIICFDIGGNSDIVFHNKNGFTIQPFNINLFVSKFIEILSLDNSQYSKFSRNFALKNWSEDIIAKKHLDVYTSVIKQD